MFQILVCDVIMEFDDLTLVMFDFLREKKHNCVFRRAWPRSVIKLINENRTVRRVRDGVAPLFFVPPYSLNTATCVHALVISWARSTTSARTATSGASGWTEEYTRESTSRPQQSST